MSDSKETLIRNFLAAERNVSRIKELVKTARQKSGDIDKKITLINDTRSLAKEATEGMTELNKSLVTLERLLAKVETLAASENSRQNATPEVRAVNQKIEAALEQVQREEAHASQLKTDVSDAEREIESNKTEFEERKQAAQVRLENVYKNIFEMRQAITVTRRDNLNRFLEKQVKLADAEIEHVKIYTHVLTYRQLLSSVQLEIAGLNSRDPTALANINREVEKIDQMLASIPLHQGITEAQVKDEQAACEALSKEIQQLDAQLKDAIVKTSRSENELDKINREIQLALDLNEDLQIKLSSADAKGSELEQLLEDARVRAKTSTAVAIDSLQKEIAVKEAELQKTQAQLKELRQTDTDTTSVPLAMQGIIQRMKKEFATLEHRKAVLEKEKLDLAAANARMNLSSSAIPGGAAEEGE
jgi:chromosome segregation ATPase